MFEILVVVGGMSLGFAVLCALSDWAVPRLLLLRRRQRIIAARAPRLARLMSEEWR